MGQLPADTPVPPSGPCTPPRGTFYFAMPCSRQSCQADGCINGSTSVLQNVRASVRIWGKCRLTCWLTPLSGAPPLLLNRPETHMFCLPLKRRPFKFYSTIYVMHLVRNLAHKPALHLMFSTPLSGQLYLRDTEQL